MLETKFIIVATKVEKIYVLMMEFPIMMYAELELQI